MAIHHRGTSETISVVGTLKVRPEHEDAFIAHTAATAAIVEANEPDTILYVIHRHPTEPHTFFFIERYRDDRALQAHAEAPYIKDAIAKLQGLLEEAPDALLLRQIIPASADPGPTV